MRRARLLPALVLALAATAGACQLLVGIGEDRFSYTPDAGPPPDTGPADLCPHARPPTLPDVPDDGEKLTFAIAGREIGLLRQATSGEAIGFDLDESCTCDPRQPSQTPSCTLPREPVRDGGCDDDGGIDNALLAGLEDPRIAIITNTLVGGSLQTNLECGRQTLLLVILNYNGRRDDPSVDIATLLSGGIRDSHAGGDPVPLEKCGGGYGDGGDLRMPRWDKSDLWSVREVDVNRPPGSDVVIPGKTTRGWVSNWMLSVDGHDTGATVPLVVGQELVTVASPRFNAKLIPVDAEGKDMPIDAAGRTATTPAAFRVEDALLSGRARATDVVSAIGRIKLGGGPNDFLCTDPAGVFTKFRTVMCNAVDLPSLAERDKKGDRCDALSLALRFSGSPASIGTTPSPASLVTTDAGCGQGYQATCDDVW